MPESTTSLAIRDKNEALALAWLAYWKPADAVWTPVELKRRKEQTDRKWPRVVFEAPRTPEDEAVEGLYRCDLSIYVGTSADEVKLGVTPSCATIHTQRGGFVSEVFGFGYKPAYLHFCTLNATDTVTAPEVALGMTYEIVTVGTTDFTLLGASANTIGTIFKATAGVSGTGTYPLGTGTGTVKRGVAVAVAGIQVYDIFVEEEVGEQTERHWFDQFSYSVVCSLRNEPSV